MGIHALALALALAPGWREDQRPLDELELADGRRLECWVLREDDETILVRVGSRARELARAEVAGMRWSRRTLEEAFARLDASDGGAVARLEVARWLASRGLAGEAEVLAWSALALDRESRGAHELLGHVERNERWRVKDGASWVRFDDLLETRRGWKDGWTLETTHWEVRTNLPLAEAADAALDLERFWLSFDALLGRELEVVDLVRHMGADLHADVESFPQALGQSRSYFDPGRNAIVVNAAQGLERGGFVHEAMHQALFGVAEELRIGQSIPGWLDEGLAVWAQLAASGQPGRLVLSPPAPSAALCAVQVEAKKPYRLGRVLTFGSDDFHASQKAELKYAQAYTLVHYLLVGEQGAHRRAFVDFVRGTFAGKGSTTDFKQAVGLSERELEQAWSAWVEANVSRPR